MGGDGGVIAVKRKFIKECRVDKDEVSGLKFVLVPILTICGSSIA